VKLAIRTDSNPVWKFFSGILRCRSIIMALALAGYSTALAGELVIYNLSHKPITCFVDGYTTTVGVSADVPFRVGPGQRLNIPSSFRSSGNLLDFVDCAGLRTRSMNITPESPDRTLFLNGQQQRVLNALLYASIPTDPNIGFTALVRWLALSYQASHPGVLLNLVLDPAIDVYSFSNLKDRVLGANGFDIAEIDTVFLKWLKQEGLINPARITGDEPWPVAKQAVMIDGQPSGVPSWLCSDFLFSTGGACRPSRPFPIYRHTWRGHRRGVGPWSVISTALGQFPQLTSRPSCRVTQQQRLPKLRQRRSMLRSLPG
jgi:hypothetical protein